MLLVMRIKKIISPKLESGKTGKTLSKKRETVSGKQGKVKVLKCEHSTFKIYIEANLYLIAFAGI